MLQVKVVNDGIEAKKTSKREFIGQRGNTFSYLEINSIFCIKYFHLEIHVAYDNLILKE